MPLMRRGNLQDRVAKRRQRQPLWNLMSQNAEACRDRAGSIAIFAFSGDDEHQAVTPVMRTQNKGNQRRMRLFDGHTMQVDPRVRL